MEPVPFYAAIQRETPKAIALGFNMETRELVHTVRCVATDTDALVIDADGALYKCPQEMGHPERAFGSVFSKMPTNPNMLSEWLLYPRLGIPACRQCAILPLCPLAACANTQRFRSESLGVEKVCQCYRDWIKTRLRLRLQREAAPPASPVGLCTGDTPSRSERM